MQMDMEVGETETVKLEVHFIGNPRPEVTRTAAVCVTGVTSYCSGDLDQRWGGVGELETPAGPPCSTSSPTHLLHLTARSHFNYKFPC